MVVEFPVEIVVVSVVAVVVVKLIAVCVVGVVALLGEACCIGTTLVCTKMLLCGR